jgi:CheY-like chemotaxis protein
LRVGGDLKVESTLGGGTRVRLEVPVSRLTGEGRPADDHVRPGHRLAGRPDLEEGSSGPRYGDEGARRHDPLAETRERGTATIEDYAKEERIRLLLVEDHASFRQVLAFMLEREPGFEVVEQAGSLAEAHALPAKSLRDVEVAVVDLTLSDGDGLDLIEDFSSAPRTVTLVLSASLEPVRFARAVEPAPPACCTSPPR